jgi:DNA transformation protein and related proteins
MKPWDPFTLHALELLGGLGPARARRMFGGAGLYVDDLFIAVIANGQLYLKVGPAQLAAFEAAGSEPFVFTAADGKVYTMGYRTAPEEAMESAEAMRPWARLAMAAALTAANERARKPARPKTSKTPKTPRPRL